MLIQLPGGSAIESDGSIVEVDDNGGVRMHSDQALGRLIEYWQKPKIRALLRTYTDELQELETAFWDILATRFVDYAYGVHLDKLGKLVGEARAGRGDATYRVRIKVRILINASFGTADDVIGVLMLLAEETFQYREFGTAFFQIVYDAPPTPQAVQQEIPGIVAETRAAGVGASVITPASTSVFMFNQTTGVPYGSGLGFSGPGTVGGDLSLYARA